jgi:hypothetical protein
MSPCGRVWVRSCVYVRVRPLALMRCALSECAPWCTLDGWQQVEDRVHGCTPALYHVTVRHHVAHCCWGGHTGWFKAVEDHAYISVTFSTAVVLTDARLWLQHQLWPCYYEMVGVSAAGATTTLWAGISNQLTGSGTVCVCRSNEWLSQSLRLVDGLVTGPADHGLLQLEQHCRVPDVSLRAVVRAGTREYRASSTLHIPIPFALRTVCSEGLFK